MTVKHNDMKRILCVLTAVCLLAACAITASVADDGHELTNIALNQYIEATSTYHPPEDFFHENYLVDGSWDTYPDSPHLGWNTNTVGDPVYEDTVVDITLFLDHAYKIEKIVLKPMKWNNGKSFPRDYQLQVSPDGDSWTDVASETNMSAVADSNTTVKPVEYTIDPVACKFFRIHITKQSANLDPGGMNTSALGELELWGYACDDSELPETEAKTYTATFVAGNQVVAKVEFKSGATSIEEPPVPEKEGYTGEWQAYVMKNGNMTIKAVYTPVEATDAPTEAPTDPVTDAPTEAPTDAPTEAPTAAPTAPADGTDDGTDTQEAGGGCASAAALSALALTLPAAAYVLYRKKHD